MTYGRPLRHYESCESTNDLAARWAVELEDPAPDGALVTADAQTKGRGRRGRGWDSGAGENVIMSLILRGKGSPDTVWQIGFVCALAVSDAFRAHGVEGRIKWPNDVLIGEKKAAGILVEIPAHKVDQDWVAVAGIGVNVNISGFVDGSNYPVPPTSLYLETGATISPLELADEISHFTESWEARRRDGSWTDIIGEVRARLAVGITLTRGGINAKLVDVGPEGQAIVQLNSGTFAQWYTVDYEAGLE